jgi:signal peptidase II
MKNKHYKKPVMYIVDLLLLGLLIFLDQWFKQLAVTKLQGKQAYSLIDGALELDYLENRGSAFGMLQNQKVLILFVSIIFMAVILFMLIKLPDYKKFIPAHVFFTMIIAGGVGNMIDRIRFDYVIDYISFILIHYPIFNFADIAVVLGVIGLIILFLFVYKEKDLEFLNFKHTKYREIDS